MEVFVLFGALFFSSLCILWRARKLFFEVRRKDPSFLEKQNKFFQSLLVVKSQFFWVVLFGNHRDLIDIKLKQKCALWRIVFFGYIILFITIFVVMLYSRL